MVKVKRPKKERYNFLIAKSVYEDFSMICDELGLVRSKNIENFMKDVVEKNKELLKKLKDEQKR